MIDTFDMDFPKVSWGKDKPGFDAGLARPRRGISFCEMLNAIAVEIMEDEEKRKALGEAPEVPAAPRRARAAEPTGLPSQSLQGPGTAAPSAATERPRQPEVPAPGAPAADLGPHYASDAPAGAPAAASEPPVRVSVVLEGGAGVLRSLEVDPGSLGASLFTQVEDALASQGKRLDALVGPGGREVDPGLSIRLSGLRDGCVVGALLVPPVRIHSTNAAFAALRSNGSVVTWGDPSCGGDSGGVRSQLLQDVVSVYSNEKAFAAVKSGGAVVTWGDPDCGGDSSDVRKQLAQGVTRVFSTRSAFAALRDDGSVVTWGAAGGDSSAARWQLMYGVRDVSATRGAFAATKDDGSVVAWGDADDGGDSSAVQGRLLCGVARVHAGDTAFAAVLGDGSVVTWGNGLYGGDSSAAAAQLAGGVEAVCSTMAAFSALKRDGSVVTWGHGPNGGDSGGVRAQLRHGVRWVYATRSAFAALRADGSVVTWGSPDCGGAGRNLPDNKRDSQSFWSIPEEHVMDARAVHVQEQLAGGVEHIVSTNAAFAAVKGDGSVVAWGDASRGGDCGHVQRELAGGVQRVFSNSSAFAAVRGDGSVVTWGGRGHGGESAGVREQLAGGVARVYSTSYAFAAVKANGDIVPWGDAGRGGGGMPSAPPSPAGAHPGRPPRLATTPLSHSESPRQFLDNAPTPPRSHRSTENTLPALKRHPGTASLPQLHAPGGALPRPRASSRDPPAHAEASQAPGGSPLHLPPRRPPARPKLPTPSNNDAFWANVEATMAPAPQHGDLRPLANPHRRGGSPSLSGRLFKQR